MKQKEEINALTPQKTVLELGKACGRKNNCCRHGSGFLVKGDIEKIAERLKLSEEEVKTKFLDEIEQFNKKMLRPKLKKYPYGECVFFENGCKIHDIKPLQCRIGNCSENGEELSAWFLVNHIVDKDDAESVRQYAMYIRCGGKVLKGAALEDIIPDKEKLAKILNYDILR